MTNDRLSSPLISAPDLRRALVFSLAMMTVAVVYANVKPFWHDEITTICLVRLPSISRLWAVLSHGPDPQPPLAYLAFKASRSLFGESHVGLRFPSMIGFLAACLVLFLFSKRRFASRYAWCAALILFVSGAFIMAFESRGYALYLAFAALSLLHWQIASEAAGTNRRLALAGLILSLAAGISTHWYFILILAPLCLGEAARTLFATKRLDPAIWLAFALGFVPLLFYGPLLRNARGFSGNFWAKPTVLSLIMTYIECFKKLSIPAAFLLALYLLPRQFRFWPAAPSDDDELCGLATHEIVASVGLACLPIIGWTLGLILHGGYMLRYVIPTYLGVALLFTQAIYWVDQRLRLPSATFPAFLILWAIANHAVLTPLLSTRGYTWPVARVDRPPILSDTNPDLPIVMTEEHQFLQQSYYRTRESPLSYSYILYTDPDQDTELLCMSRTRGLYDADIEEYDEFLQQHPRFYLLTSPGNRLRNRLVADGLRLEMLREEQGTQLELVEPSK